MKINRVREVSVKCQKNPFGRYYQLRDSKKTIIQ